MSAEVEKVEKGIADKGQRHGRTGGVADDSVCVGVWVCVSVWVGGCVGGWVGGGVRCVLTYLMHRIRRTPDGSDAGSDFIRGSGGTSGVGGLGGFQDANPGPRLFVSK